MTKTLIEEAKISEEEDTEIETEKDHTSLIAPIKEYHQRFDISIKTFENDLAELTKIKDRVRADATNLNQMASKDRKSTRLNSSH